MTPHTIVFLAVQMSLLLIIGLHDWIDFRPFTNIKVLSKKHTVGDRLGSTTINVIFVLVPLIATIVYHNEVMPRFLKWLIFVDYGLLSMGAILAWWAPYFFGSTKSHKEGFSEYRDTHTFLPKRGDNVVPNTLHVIMHLHMWTCFVFSIWLLTK